MNHTVRFDEKDKIIIGKCDGMATIDGFHSYIAELVNPPFSEVSYPVLSDFTGIDMRNLTPDDIRKIVEYVGEIKEKILSVRHAMVVSEKLAYGFARMYQISAGKTDPQEIRVLYDIKEARKWLLSK